MNKIIYFLECPNCGDPAISNSYDYKLPVCKSCLTPLSVFDIKRVMKDRRIINNEDRKEKISWK